MPTTYPNYIDRFIQHLQHEKQFSVHTITAYQNDLRNFWDYLEIQYGVATLEAIKPVFIRSWLAQMKLENLTSKSIVRKISTLKSFFKFLLIQGAIQKNPMAAISSPKIEKRLPVFFDEKTTGLLFGRDLFPDSFKGRTHYLILAILYATGMRESELIGLTLEQVDLANRQLKVLGKRRKERIIPISGELVSAIENYLQEVEKTRQAGPYLFTTPKGKPLYPKYVYNIVTHYLSYCTTLQKKSPHIMRHTFATQLLNNGAELNDVKELLGHSSLAATQVYTHNTIEKLKESFRQAHPKA